MTASPRSLTRSRALGAMVLIGALAINGHTAIARAQRPTVVPGPARVTLTTDKPTFFLGENALVHYCIEPSSADPIAVSYGGDYRGGTRSFRFALTATDEQGRVASDPDRAGNHLGGLGGVQTLKPGARWCQSLPVMRYARIEQAGTFDIRVTHDLGWPAGQAPVGHTPLRFVMPTAAEAEDVVAGLAAIPPAEAVFGRLSAPYRDYATLRYAVYLGPLTPRARRGERGAIEGIGAIPTPEATEVLVELLSHADREVARWAQQHLAMRLPDPALTGALPARGPFVDGSADPRRYLRDASWRAEFAPAVRASARALLASSDAQDQVQGAFMIQAVGESADAAALASALTVAIEKTPTLPFERGYPRPRGAVHELLRAATALVARGYAPEAPTLQRPVGDTALWIVAMGRGVRSPGWEGHAARLLAHPIPYIRELTLTQTPDAVPASIVDALRATLEPAGDIDVQIAACELVRRAKLKALRDPVLVVLQTANEGWLVRAAANALWAIGSRIEALTVRAQRLAEPEVVHQMLDALVELLDSHGRDTPEQITAAQGRVLSARWLSFISDRRADIEAGRLISLDSPGVTPDLVPPGMRLKRTGKPDWPLH